MLSFQIAKQMSVNEYRIKNGGVKENDRGVHKVTKKRKGGKKE